MSYQPNPNQPNPNYGGSQPAGYPVSGYEQQPVAGYPQPAQYGQPQPVYGYAAAPTTPAKAVTPPWTLAVMIVGGLLLIVCAFLPWVSIDVGGSTITVNGLGQVSGLDISSKGGDGTLAIGLGVILVILGGLGFVVKGKGVAIGGMVFGVLAVIIMGYDSIGNIGNPSGDSIAVAKMGIGVYVGLGGAIVALVGAILVRTQSKAKV